MNVEDFLWTEDDETKLIESLVSRNARDLARLTYIEALIVVYGAQTFLRLPFPDGNPYGPGFFIKRDWIGALKGENRRVSLRLAKAPCIRCKSILPVDSTGDHIIAISIGGPLGAQNYLPPCRPCNASKGKKDLLDWWYDSGRSATDLPYDVLCAYARLMFGWLKQKLAEPAPEPLKSAARDLSRLLPSVEHRRRLIVTAKRCAENYFQFEGGL